MTRDYNAEAARRLLKQFGYEEDLHLLRAVAAWGEQIAAEAWLSFKVKDAEIAQLREEIARLKSIAAKLEGK